MPDSPPGPDRRSVRDLLRGWVVRSTSQEGAEWLDERVARVAGEDGDRELFLAFSLAPRKIGKRDLTLSAEELVAADRSRPGWWPGHWSVDQAARSLLLLSRPADDEGAFTTALDRLRRAADVGESVALYQSLPLLPHPDVLASMAAEGLRTNMTSVFEAIALDNPYPAEYLDEPAWNQMVLKALFVGSSVHRIQGLDARANERLAEMLLDFVRERRAAGRSVDPGLWRCLGTYGGEDAVELLSAGLESDDPGGRAATALALARSTEPAASDLLDRHPELRDAVLSGALTWDTLPES